MIEEIIENKFAMNIDGENVINGSKTVVQSPYLPSEQVLKSKNFVELTESPTLSNENAANEAKQNECLKTSSFEMLNFQWKRICRLDLNLKYARIFSGKTCTEIFCRLEKEIEYYSGDLSKVRVFGKWHPIPRKQVAYGDDGIIYKFSGISVPGKSWSTSPTVFQLKHCVEAATGEKFNFVLVNRYANGKDYMGEHRDDEKDLVQNAPIASLSFGQVRDFIFRHKNSRGKNSKQDISTLKMELESGSLLLMESPTNKFWYHSLPVRKQALGVRINLTFRKMVL